jgi:enoyl-CoA hydratase
VSERSLVVSERIGQVLRITIDRPEALNALNSDVLLRLASIVEQAAEDREARAVVITGSGDRAFIAGADIKEMSTKSPQEGREFARVGHRITRLIEEMDKPVIAAINGVALGGGCEVALACDVRVASDRARLGQPEVNLGIMPGWGGTVRLARIVGEGIAREIVFSGRLVSADEAFRIGLVNTVYPPEKLAEESMQMAAGMAGRAPLAMAYAKRSMNRARSLDMEAAAELEADLFGLLFATEDQKEGMAAFIEKRSASFVGR